MALAFALLTLIASAPHRHGIQTASSYSGVSAYAAEAVGIGAVPLCILCDWLTTPAVVSAPPVLLLIVALGALPALGFSAQARCPRPVPHRRLRAPPA